MASGFAGGVVALVWSRFPKLTNDQVRQILRNTTTPAKKVVLNDNKWEPQLGYGILNAARAVKLKEEQLCRDVRLLPSKINLIKGKGGLFIKAKIHNKGVLDANRAIVVAYNGNPEKTPSPEATTDKPAKLLQTKQIGHSITDIRGLCYSDILIKPFDKPSSKIWFETFCLDLSDTGKLHRCSISFVR